MDRLILRLATLALLAVAGTAMAETTKQQAKDHMKNVDLAIKDGVKLINANAGPGTLGVHSRKVKSIVAEGDRLFGNPWDDGKLKYCAVATHRAGGVWSQILNVKHSAAGTGFNAQAEMLKSADDSYKEALKDCNDQIKKIR